MVIGIDGNEANLKNRVGVNQYAAEVLRHLERLPGAKKHEFVIYLKGPPLSHMPAQRKGWRYKVLLGRGFWNLRVLTPHLWFSKNRPNILFAPSHYAPPFCPVPSVISIMDLGYLQFPEQFKRHVYWQLKYWSGRSIKQARKIIAISQSTKRDIEKNYPSARGKVEVTHLGYDRDKFKFPVPEPQIAKAKKRYGIEGDYILFLSTLKPSKNIEGLLEAFKIIITKNQLPITLVIAGKRGWLYDRVFEKIKGLGIDDRVIFTDFVPEKDKPALVAGARVFASPSFWEGFGLHVLEAMAVGTPVVVSNVGSLPEIVGEAGTLVDPSNPHSIAEGLGKVVSMPENEYNKQVEAGLSQARKFSWEKTARETLRVLEKTGE